MKWLLPTMLSTLTGCGASVLGACEDIPVGGDVSIEVASLEELEGAERLDHVHLTGVLATFTQAFEHEAGGTFRLVDYPALDTAEANIALGDYLSVLATVSPAELATREEKFAYYLNTYNAWVLQGVLGKLQDDPDYDVESDSFALFTTRYIEIDGLLFSPNMVEHGIARGDPYTIDDVAAVEDPALAEAIRSLHDDLWQGETPDARMHVGFNCASMGCPNLGGVAFRGDLLDAQLDALATEFLDNRAKGAGPDGVTQLFSWYRSDFEADFGSVEAFVQTYRTDGDEDVDYGTTLPYDWELNGVDRW